MPDKRSVLCADDRAQCRHPSRITHNTDATQTQWACLRPVSDWSLWHRSMARHYCETPQKCSSSRWAVILKKILLWSTAVDELKLGNYKDTEFCHKVFSKSYFMISAFPLLTLCTPSWNTDSSICFIPPLNSEPCGRRLAFVLISDALRSCLLPCSRVYQGVN